MPAVPTLTATRRPSVSVARALGSSTRAAILEALRETGEPRSAREVAADFDLHPNVARTHLEVLADAALVDVGLRKHPQGGRPAKTYAARAAAASAAPAADPLAGWQLLVRILAGVADPGASRPAGTTADRAAAVARLEGRDLVAALGPRVPTPGLRPAVDVVVRALRAVVPDVRVLGEADGWVDVAGTDVLVAPLADDHRGLGDAIERGIVTGALAAAGIAATVAAAGPQLDGGRALRVRLAGTGRAPVLAAATVEARGAASAGGVVAAMRVVTDLQPGDVLEVLAEGPGSPAAFARWADRAGHTLLGVERAVDDAGTPAIRLLIRKGR